MGWGEKEQVHIARWHPKKSKMKFWGGLAERLQFRDFLKCLAPRLCFISFLRNKPLPCPCVVLIYSKIKLLILILQIKKQQSEIVGQLIWFCLMSSPDIIMDIYLTISNWTWLLTPWLDVKHNTDELTKCWIQLISFKIKLIGNSPQQ